MNSVRVLHGVVVWSLGLAIPAFWHALLMNAAVQEDEYAYSFHNMAKHFFDMPWIIWPFMISTALFGTLLVITGLGSRTSENQ